MTLPTAYETKSAIVLPPEVVLLMISSVVLLKGVTVCVGYVIEPAGRWLMGQEE
jgi:hypothetical protein